MKTTIALALAGTMLAVTPAWAAAAKSSDAAAPMMKVETNVFVRAVKSSGMFEIKSSELAQQKSSDAAIKEFAAQMISDHKKAVEKLMTAAGKLGDEPVEPAPKHAAMLKLLEGASGVDFDMIYLDMQAGAHMEAVSLFQTYAGSGDAPAVKSFAKETLPTLETHLTHVKMIVASH